MSRISLDPQQEQKLIVAAQKDISNFTPLYTHYYPHILRFTLSKLHSKEVAEDITAQTFQKAIQSIQSFKWQGTPFSAWLYQITKRLIIDCYRKQARQKTTDFTGQSEDTLPASNYDLQALAIDSIHSDTIQAELLTFSSPEREIIYLKFYLGYTNKLIAQTVNISETNVGTIIHRSVKKLKERLS